MNSSLMAWVRTGVAPALRPHAPRDLGLALIGAVMIVLATVILIGLFAFFSVLLRMV